MKISADQYLVKQMNNILVLDIIRKQSPISKPELERDSGLNKGTISRIVNELVYSKIINEMGTGESTGGRKPALYSLNSQAGYTLGIEVKTNAIYSAISDLNGNFISKSAIKITPSSFDEFFNELIKFIDEMIVKVPTSTLGITGLGIAFPGIVNQEGDIMIAPSFKWQDIPFKSQLEKYYNFPIIIENDARLGLIGEKKFGLANHSSNILYITINENIGSGIIINNKLMRGSTGFSGQVGHFSIQTNGIDCTCGNKGCWHLYASTKAIIETACKNNNLKPLLLTTDRPLDYLIRLAEEGDQHIIKIFKKTGTYIGTGLVNLINLLNPETIVIAGKITALKKWIYNDMVDVIDSRALHSRNQNINILFSELGEDASLMGATSFVLDDLFTNDIL